jgi:cytochrome d ubiquinol oxidase subunit I
MSLSAYYILKKRHLDFAHKTFKVGLVLSTVAALLALGTGHFQADNVAEHQPAKLAAFEGHYETGPGTLYLFGLPSNEQESVRFGMGIPGGLSFLVDWDFTAPVTGLDAFPPDNWPNVFLVFQTYHAMIALGMAFITLVGCFFWWRGTLFQQRWLLWVFVFAVGGAFLANQLGWASAELGRQPWIVYDLLRTNQAISEAVTGGMVMSSIIMFGLIYLLLFFVWIYVLNSKIQHGPEAPEPAPEKTTLGSLVEAAARRTDPGGYSMSSESRS